MIPSGLHVEGAWMRGSDRGSGSLFSYVDLEQRVPARHPLRVILAIVNDVLVALDGEFEKLYEGTGRHSVAPERLMIASLLQAFYSCLRTQIPRVEKVRATAFDPLQTRVTRVHCSTTSNQGNVRDHLI